MFVCRWKNWCMNIFKKELVHKWFQGRNEETIVGKDVSNGHAGSKQHPPIKIGALLLSQDLRTFA